MLSCMYEIYYVFTLIKFFCFSHFIPLKNTLSEEIANMKKVQDELLANKVRQMATEN